MSVWHVIWVVTTQVVNFSFYLAITRMAYGWWRTLGAYLIYLAPFALLALSDPTAVGGLQGAARDMPVSFATSFALWAVLTLAMSRGVLGRRIFAVFVAGVHQVGAISLSMLAMHHARAEWIGGLVACAVMVLMGVAMASRGLRSVRRMTGDMNWDYLNLTAVVNFTLLYASGIWPIFVATSGWDHICLFLVANAVTIAYAPVFYQYAEKSRSGAMLALVQNNMQLMANEMRARRSAIDEARRLRHDRRHHRIAVSGMLLNGKIQEALAYMGALDEGYDETALTKLVWCENETVNAILSGYSRRALAAKVRFSAVANVGRQIAMPDVEIVALVSNLVENAILAAGENGEVTCKLRQREDSFGLTVTNTVPPDFALSSEGLPCDVRGIGLESVNMVIAKYHGECRYSVENCVLTCESVVFVGGG